MGAPIPDETQFNVLVKYEFKMQQASTGTWAVTHGKNYVHIKLF